MTDFAVSTGCQANWDFNMDKALAFLFTGIFCRCSKFLLLYQETVCYFTVITVQNCLNVDVISNFIFIHLLELS